jgi:hypothetical protein
VRGIVRDYQPSDFERVREIHEAKQIDYKFPDLNSPLFLVTKVLEVDGIVRQCGGLYLQVEAYLWSDDSEWGTPQEKLEGIQALDREAMHEAWFRGIDCCVLWLPPGMARFGDRLVEDLGFNRDRSDWISYSKTLCG